MKRYYMLACTFLLAACAGTEPSASKESEGDLPYIGILQLTSHPALDAITEGTIDQLAENGYVDGETAIVEVKNAQGDQSNLQTSTEYFLSNDPDVLIGIATPAAQALANATSDIPIVMGAITDPVAANLVESMERPGGNVTGVSDQIPVDEQFKLIKDTLPDVQSIGLLYSSSEPNSQSAAEQAIMAADALGIETVTMTVNNANDVVQVAESLASQVDAIWVPTDNTVATSTVALVEITDANQIPVFPSVDTMVDEGGLAAIGLNQYELGRQTGMVAIDLLEGADPSTYAVQVPTNLQTLFNEEKAKALGITLPPKE